jgi:hypothetical protein
LPVPSRASSRDQKSGLTRNRAGDEVADELGIPDAPLKHLIPLLRPAIQATDLLRRLGQRDDAHIANRTMTRAQTLLDTGHGSAGVVAAEEAGATIQPATVAPCATDKAYVDRRIAEGKTFREIRRCLERYIARERYRGLTPTCVPW